MPQTISVSDAVSVLQQGRVIAYPTESIYGLGCDPWNPDAVSCLLDLKLRSIESGFILVAASFDQVESLVESVPQEKMDKVMATWPGHTTWLFPAKHDVPTCLRGNHQTIALRISSHPVIKALCQGFGGPIISTSANITDHPPARSAYDCYVHFHHELSDIVEGDLGDESNPSEIRDVMSGDIIR
mgnify:CR=1 FL=1|jgi:L-threonylcarbamoyladenylate synthase